jgi:hypothetical protein
MRNSGFVLLIATISLLLTSAPALGVVVYRAEGQVVGRSGQGATVPVAGTLSVTIEANLDSPTDVREAVDLSKNLLEGLPTENVVMVEMANTEGPVGAESRAIVDEFRETIPEGRRSLVSLSKDGVTRLSSMATRAGFMAASAVRSTVTDPFRLSVTLTRFVSATGAVYVGISLASGLPLNVERYFGTLSQTAWTGLMSAGMTMFSDVYSEFIIKPGFLARKIDDSKTLRAVVERFKNGVRGLRGGAGPDAREGGTQKSALGLDVGLYADQFLKSLSLEFAFVYGSTLASSGVSAANASLSHILTGVLNGGLGQMFFDQSIAILANARKAKIRERYPEGPERDARLKKVDRQRDVAMAVNSLAQVWMVMIATRGNSYANAALHLYMAAGAIVRASVIPIEKKLNRPGNTVPPATTVRTEQRTALPRARPLRCEAIFSRAT